MQGKDDIMNKKLISCVLAVLLFATSGCASVQINIRDNNTSPDTVAATAGDESDKTQFGGGKPWIDSEIKENVSEDTPTDPRDDFHLYANKDWLLANEIPAGYMDWSHFSKRELEVKEQCIDLLSDDSLTGHDADLVRTYNALVLDWDSRDAAGVSEIKDLYDEILAVRDTEDLTRLLTDSDTGIELFSFINIQSHIGFNDPDTYIVAVESPELLLKDSAEYRERTELGDMYYGMNKDTFTYLASRMGMDKAEAERRFNNAIDTEAALAENVYTSAEQYDSNFYNKANNELSFDELVALSEVFPLKDIIAFAGYDYDGTYITPRLDYFSKLDEIYTDDNIDGLRDLVLVRYLITNSSHLDRETYDRKAELIDLYFGTGGAVPDEEMAYDRVVKMLPTSMQKVYISKYGSEEDRQKMADLCREVIDTYREILTENEWASDKVKDYAIQKLDNIGIHAAYPDKFRDTSDIDLAGCSLIEADRRIAKANRDYNRSLAGTKKDKEMWAEGFDILSCNAFYDQGDNTVNMIIGMMGEPFFSSDMSTEELYASIGAFWVGHEISHAFDSGGAQFDAEGKLRDWWTPGDKEEFNRRVGKMDDYLDGIIAFGDKHFIGQSIDTEMVADMTGLQCALRMASKVDGFDYDSFFTKYAELNASLCLYSRELVQLQQDSHPLNYSRTNVPVQQFEEFYKTYDVKEGDNMYLAPEDRLIVW